MHTSKPYVNGHCFVALTVAFPRVIDHEVEYFMFPFAMRMYDKTNQSKLDLVYEMAERALKFFNHKQRIILACDNWYPKGKVLDFIKEHRSADFIANIRRDSTSLVQLVQENVIDLENMVINLVFRISS